MNWERRKALIQFLLSPLHDIELFGMYWSANLGDEAIRIAELAKLPQHRTVPTVSGSNWRVFDKLLQLRRKKHLIVGGGTLVGQVGWIDYVEWRVKQGSALHFFGTGIAFTEDQQTNSNAAFNRWSRVIASAKNVAVRGPLSQEIARKMGVEAEIFGDAAFLLYNEEMVNRDHSRREHHVGFNVGECTKNQADFEEKCAFVLKKLLLQDYAITVFVVTPSDEVSTERVVRQLGADSERVRRRSIYHDPFKFMNSVKNMKLFVGTKMHAAGLAMIAGTPSLMIEYAKKCRDFVAPIGLENTLVSPTSTSDHLLTRVYNVLDCPAESVNTDQIRIFSLSQCKRLQEVRF